MPQIVTVLLCNSVLAPSPFNWPGGSVVIFRRSNDIFGPCPVFNIIICQNHINLMYDRPIKWIHLGLQESSLINSDIYSCGFDAAVLLLWNREQECQVSLTLFAESFVSWAAQRDRINQASSPGLCEAWLAPLPVPRFPGKGNIIKTRHMYTNPTSLITSPR